MDTKTKSAFDEVSREKAIRGTFMEVAERGEKMIKKWVRNVLIIIGLLTVFLLWQLIEGR